MYLHEVHDAKLLRMSTLNTAYTYPHERKEKSKNYEP